MNARIWSAAGVKNMACTPRITQTTPLFFKPYALLEPPPDLRFIYEVGAAKLRFQVTLFVGDEPAGDPPDKEGHHHDGRQAPQQDPEANQDERHGNVEGIPAVSVRALSNQGGRLLERDDRRVVAPELHRSPESHQYRHRNRQRPQRPTRPGQPPGDRQDVMQHDHQDDGHQSAHRRIESRRGRSLGVHLTDYFAAYPEKTSSPPDDRSEKDLRMATFVLVPG